MPLRRRQHQFRPSLQLLESRDAPANLTASFNADTRTLTVTGDGDNNQLQIRAVAGDPTRFLLSSPVDTINNVMGDYQSPTGVHNLTTKLYAGDDSVEFRNSAGPVVVRKNVTIHGGDGANNVTASDLTVGGNLSVRNGTNTTLDDSTYLVDLRVGGSLTINNGDGDSITGIYRNSAGLSYIGGNYLLTNGSGVDQNYLIDTNVGGSVKVNSGLPDAGDVAGNTRIYNSWNTTARSVIGGSVSVSYRAGSNSIRDGIWDTHVLGNVTFNHGPGTFTTFLDGFATSLPVKINGKVTLTGTGANQIYLGAGWDNTGLVVGGALSVQCGPVNDTLTLNKVAVGGATLLNLGNGNNTATINDCDFGGTFTLRATSGADTVNLDTATGTSQATTFARNVLMYLGDGGDTVARAGSADANQRIVFYRSFVIHHGPGADTTSTNAAQEISPFGSLIQWVV